MPFGDRCRCRRSPLPAPPLLLQCGAVRGPGRRRGRVDARASTRPLTAAWSRSALPERAPGVRAEREGLDGDLAAERCGAVADVPAAGGQLHPGHGGVHVSGGRQFGVPVVVHREADAALREAAGGAFVDGDPARARPVCGQRRGAAGDTAAHHGDIGPCDRRAVRAHPIRYPLRGRRSMRPPAASSVSRRLPAGPAVQTAHVAGVGAARERNSAHPPHGPRAPGTLAPVPPRRTARSRPRRPTLCPRTGESRYGFCP